MDCYGSRQDMTGIKSLLRLNMEMSVDKRADKMPENTQNNEQLGNVVILYYKYYSINRLQM